MVARRSAGSGVVVGMVVAVIVAFTAIGASIFLYQKLAQAKSALASNQKMFQDTVGDVFKERKWTLTPEEDQAMGVRYGHKSYQDVTDRLREAATFEDMAPLLGDWKDAEIAQGTLDDSALARDRADAPFRNLSELMSGYDTAYKRMGGLLAANDQEIADLNGQLKVATETFDAETRRLNAAAQKAVEEQKNAEAAAAANYGQLNAKYNNARREVDEWAQKYRDALQQAEVDKVELREEARDWEGLYQDLLKSQQPGETMLAEGKVLSVEESYEFLMLEGGDDVGRKPNNTLVVYSVSPLGVETYKGAVIVNKVYSNTALAGVLSQNEPMMKGDLFVPKVVWEAFHEVEAQSAPVAAVPAEVQPAEVKQPEVAPRPEEGAGTTEQPMIVESTEESETTTGDEEETGDGFWWE